MNRLRKNKKRLQGIVNQWKKLKRIAPVEEKESYNETLAMLYVLRNSQSKALRKRFAREQELK